MTESGADGISLEPLIIPRAKHNISRSKISANALKVLYRLKDAGYHGYLVGGGVRDLLLEQNPKDFDIVTDALPNEVRKLFRNCRLIGRRFRLAHVYFGNEIIEVVTFRACHEQKKLTMRQSARTEAGMLLRDNVYGTIEQDVLRRDFTVNAIYYNIQDFSLVDYVGGLEDFNKRQLRIIGDPDSRYREDPVRMLRAIRFASKLNFQLHAATAAPISSLADLLTNVAPARLFEEYIKLFFAGYATDAFDKLNHYELYQRMFPQVYALLEQDPTVEMFIKQALANTDSRVKENKPVAPAFLLAVFLWHALQIKVKSLEHSGMPKFLAYQKAMENVLKRQKDTIMIPKRFVTMMQDIWLLQIKFTKRTVRNVMRTYQAPRFRAAYDFLLLRAEIGCEEVKALATWWQNYVTENDAGRSQMLRDLSATQKRKKNIKQRKDPGK